MGTRTVRLYVPNGVGKGGGFVAVGVCVGGGVFEGVSVGPAVGEGVSVAVFVADGRGVGELVDVATMGGNSVFVGDGLIVAVAVPSLNRARDASSEKAAWLTSLRSLANMPDAESSNMIRSRRPTQPMPST